MFHTKEHSTLNSYFLEMVLGICLLSRSKQKPTSFAAYLKEKEQYNQSHRPTDMQMVLKIALA